MDGVFSPSILIFRVNSGGMVSSYGILSGFICCDCNRHRDFGKALVILLRPFSLRKGKVTSVRDQDFGI